MTEIAPAMAAEAREGPATTPTTPSVGRNASVTLATAMIQILALLVTVPLYIHLIGVERYGVLSIVWLLLDYLGLFSLGLDRAVTAFLARHRSIRDQEEILTSALSMNLVLGGVAALILFSVGHILLVSGRAPQSLGAEIAQALPFIALALPVAMMTSVLIGAIEAHERFGLLALLQLAGTLLFQGLPLATAAWIQPTLPVVVSAAVLARVASAALMLAGVLAIMNFQMRPVFRARWVPKLLKFGGWVGLTGLVSPLLASFDRLIIGWVIGPAAVSHYVVPSSLVNRITILPASLVGPLFPRIARADGTEAERLSREAIIALAVIIGPILVVGAAALQPFMMLWVGADFAEDAHGIGEIFIIGLWFNCIAFVPLVHLQAQWRPDLVAKIHVLEILPFFAALWVGVHYFGIIGAACAWVFRVTLDGLFLLGVSRLATSVLKPLVFPTLLVLATSISSAIVTDLWWKAGIGASAGTAMLIWSVLSAPQSVRHFASRVATMLLRKVGLR